MDDKVTITRNGKSVKASLNNGKSSGLRTPSGSGDGEMRLMDSLRTATGLIQRLQLANLAGMQFGGDRDLYKVFGYKKNPTEADFLAKYVRQDIAGRIVDAPPGATWSNPPEIEQELQNGELRDLAKRTKLWQAMYRADRLARLNPFSLLLFGFNDTGNTQARISPDRVDDLLYVRAIPSRLVDEITFNNNVRDKRFGQPELYTIKFDDPETKSVSAGKITVKGQRELRVHWSRVVHIVENPLEDEIFGTPIIEKVFNLLDDLLKVAGGTAETYWLTGRGGLQADIDKEMDFDPDDAAALADEIEEYVHQLRRVIRTRGVDISTIDTKTPNPKEIFEMIVSMISGTTGIPKRILLGSEAGQLASEQDRANWAERIDERRELFATPSMLQPTILRFQEVGLISEGDVTFKWPDAFVQNPLERAQTMAQKARAIGNISRQTGNKTPMQLTSREEAREILGLEGDLPESEIIEQEEEDTQETQPFGQQDPEEQRPPAQAQD